MPRNRQSLHKWFPHVGRPFLANGPMLGHTNGLMAAAVSKAGGLGMIAGPADTSKQEALEALHAELRQIRQAMSLKDTERMPIIIGVVTFFKSAHNLATAIAPTIRQYRPAGIWLFAPDNPSPHANIIPDLKKLDDELKIFVQVGSVAAAREAVEHGADVICAQGVDAGGHQLAHGAGIISLLPEVSDMLVQEFSNRDIGLLAAGGIVDGRGVAAALALGADGVVMGTRFVVSEECPSSAATKQVYVRTADGGISTVKSPLHDDVRGTGYWPKLYDGRAIIGGSWEDLQKGSAMNEVKDRYKEAVTKGDTLSRAIIWSGTGVGMIHEVKSAGDIVRDIQEETMRVLSEVANL